MTPQSASQKQQDKYHSDKTCHQLKKSTTTKLITHSQTGLYMVPWPHDFQTMLRYQNHKNSSWWAHGNDSLQNSNKNENQFPIGKGHTDNNPNWILNESSPCYGRPPVVDLSSLDPLKLNMCKYYYEPLHEGTSARTSLKVGNSLLMFSWCEDAVDPKYVNSSLYNRFSKKWTPVLSSSDGFPKNEP